MVMFLLRISMEDFRAELSSTDQVLIGKYTHVPGEITSVKQSRNMYQQLISYIILWSFAIVYI